MESISDFAEKLLMEDLKTKSPAALSNHVNPATPDPGQRDITDIVVPSGFADTILTEAFDIKTEPRKQNPVDEQKKYLLQKFKVSLNEVRNVLQEMMMSGSFTGTGHLGHAMGGHGTTRRPRRTRKRGSNSSYKRK